MPVTFLFWDDPSEPPHQPPTVTLQTIVLLLPGSPSKFYARNLFWFHNPSVHYHSQVFQSCDSQPEGQVGNLRLW